MNLFVHTEDRSKLNPQLNPAGTDRRLNLMPQPSHL